MKIGVVDAGGGFRGSYGAGVLDHCLLAGIHFDVGVGVSAGSGNIASYLAMQFRRNYRFYTDYAFRSAYAGMRQLIAKGSYIDLSYLYEKLSRQGGENPLNYQALSSNPASFVVVATDALTGLPHYFDKRDIRQDHYEVFMASSCVPLAAKPCVIQGVPYYDGALSDPVPYKKAFAMGCDKVVIILTRPRAFRRTSGKDRKLSHLMRQYPEAARALADRAEVYNRELDEAECLVQQGKVLIIAPDDIAGMKTLTKDRQKVIDLYEKGARDAVAIDSFIAH